MRNVAAGATRAAICAAPGGEQIARQQDGTDADDQGKAGNDGAGTTPMELAKLTHAQRPAAIPSGMPATAAATRIVVVCQAITARTCTGPEAERLQQREIAAPLPDGRQDRQREGQHRRAGNPAGQHERLTSSWPASITAAPRCGGSG